MTLLAGASTVPVFVVAPGAEEAGGAVGATLQYQPASALHHPTVHLHTAVTASRPDLIHSIHHVTLTQQVIAVFNYNTSYEIGATENWSLFEGEFVCEDQLTYKTQ